MRIKKPDFATSLLFLMLATFSIGAVSEYVVGDKLSFNTADSGPVADECTTGCVWSDGTTLRFRGPFNFDQFIGGVGYPYNTSLTSRAAGTYYLMGYFEMSSTDANLTQASPTVTWGNNTVGYGAHAASVAGGAGTANGTCSLVVSGTSYNGITGTITTSDSETIVADVTAETLNNTTITSRKWLGQITYTLTLGTATTCSFDFNYGFNRHEDAEGVDYTIDAIRCSGVAGANDTAFEIEFIEDNADWTYAATGFVPGPAATDKYTTKFSTYSDLVNGEYFDFFISYVDIITQRAIDNEHYVVRGSTGNGFVIRVTTGASNSVRNMNCYVFVASGTGT